MKVFFVRAKIRNKRKPLLLMIFVEAKTELWIPLGSLKYWETCWVWCWRGRVVLFCKQYANSHWWCIFRLAEKSGSKMRHQAKIGDGKAKTSRNIMLRFLCSKLRSKSTINRAILEVVRHVIGTINYKKDAARDIILLLHHQISCRGQRCT